MQKVKNGYSTVEILIALFIILLLGGFVISAFSLTRETARTKACVTNIKQLSNALTLYIQDYDGTYPAFSAGSFKQIGPNPNVLTTYKGANWSEMLLPYISKDGSTILRCPSGDMSALPKDTRIYLTFGYACNLNLSEASYNKYQKTNEIYGSPDYKLNFDSLTVTLADARLGIVALGGPDETELSHLNALYSRKLKQQIANQRLGATRHQGGANYAFADGHVKWFKPEQLDIKKKCDGKTPGFGL